MKNFFSNLSTASILLMFMAGIVVLMVLLGFASYFYVNTTRNNIINLETQLSANDQNMQIELGKHLSTVESTLSFVKFDTQQKKELGTSLISGVFNGQTSINNVGLVNSLQQVYPELKGDMVKTQEVIDAFKSGQAAFSNSMRNRADMVRVYEVYLNSNLIRSFVIRNVIYAPTQNLKVNRGGSTYTGAAAIPYLNQLILTTGTQNAVTSGTMPNLTAN